MLIFTNGSTPCVVRDGVVILCGFIGRKLRGSARHGGKTSTQDATKMLQLICSSFHGPSLSAAHKQARNLDRGAAPCSFCLGWCAGGLTSVVSYNFVESLSSKLYRGLGLLWEGVGGPKGLEETPEEAPSGPSGTGESPAEGPKTPGEFKPAGWRCC